MMDEKLYGNYLAILKSELVPALGCTEPIAIALASAKARETLGAEPERIELHCSGNIVKNVMGVTVPNSGGLKGLAAAVAMGAAGGKAEKGLEVLGDLDDAARKKAAGMLSAKKVSCHLEENAEPLYIRVEMSGGGGTAAVEIRSAHDHIAKIEKDGAIIHQRDAAAGEAQGDRELLSVRAILQFADELDIEDVRELLDRMLEYNRAIAEEGLRQPYGAQVGRTLLTGECKDIYVMARAVAAAASDARMGGCPMPVVINSGSGNQGIAVSLPVYVYATGTGAPKEKLYRALALANLILVHEKRFIGNLSAYCGASSAGCAAACGIAYLDGAGYEVIADTIVNTLATIGGMVCDGAKSSCAAKVSSAIEAGVTGCRMAKQGIVFQSGEGLVEGDVEETIRRIGRMGREGMRSTDIEILKMMLGE